MIPFAGSAVTGARLAAKTVKAVDAISDGAKTADNVADTVKAADTATDTAKAAPAAPAAPKDAPQAAPSCKNSFVPGTRVVMADGSSKNIEDLNVGEQVLATDPETGDTRAREVTDTRNHKSDKHLTTLTVDPDGKDGQAKPGKITSTSAHLFWLPDAGKWVKAQQLEPGMWLQTSSGTWIQVTAIDDSHRSERVHNLTVAGVHTYYVLAGATPVLVHNCGGALLDRARELYATRADEASTVAVARVRNVNTGRSETWVATERTGLPDEWRGGNAPLRGERYIPGQGHAEATIMNRLGSDWEIAGMASSTRMCPACFAQATGPGVGLTPSPIGKGTGVSSTGNTPWRVVLGGGG
jgi:hypothetical protein